MASAGITAADIRAVGAATRPGAVAEAVPARGQATPGSRLPQVRPDPGRPDPQRSRFDLPDGVGRKPDAARPPRVAPAAADPTPWEEERGASDGAPAPRVPAGGGAFTAFLAQSLAQEDGAAEPAPSAFQAASAAYAPPAGGQSAAAPAPEILTPFPRLASGRALDLSV